MRIPVRDTQHDDGNRCTDGDEGGVRDVRDTATAQLDPSGVKTRIVVTCEQFVASKQKLDDDDDRR
jgi:hypothetical protein